MSAGIKPLDRSIQLTLEWLNEIQEEFKWPNKDRVYDATKAVLLATRDRLTIEEAHQFAAQIPMVMKGMFFDGYDPTDKPMLIRNRDKFLEHVRKHFGDRPLDSENAVRTVAKVLRKKISEGQYEDVVGSMPKEIQKLYLE
jgi:uncharacterized protein (DUF2267 family)